MTQDIADSMGLPSTQGALVADVTAGGPAAKAGLQNGDFVTSFDGKPVSSSTALPRMVADTPIGKTVGVEVLRKGRKQSFRVAVAKLAETTPDKPGAKLPPPVKAKSKVSQLGLTLGALDAAARAKFRLAGSIQGVLVTDVDPNGAAAEKNLRPGDVIVEVQSQPVKTPDEVEARLTADAKAGKKVELLLINRGGDSVYVGLRLD